MDEHGLQVDELERGSRAGLRPKLLYSIPDHQNPAGVSLSGERRAPLVELARRYGFVIVEDVAYRELGFSGDTSRASGASVRTSSCRRGRRRRRCFPGSGSGGRSAPPTSRPGSSPRSRTPTSAPALSGSGSSRSAFAAGGSTSSWCSRVRCTSGRPGACSRRSSAGCRKGRSGPSLEAASSPG